MMRYMSRLVLVTVVLGAVLAACGSDDPSRTVQTGDELFSVSFDAPGAWEEGAYPAGEEPDSVLRIADGRYHLSHHAGRSASFTWGQGGDAIEDVIVEVQAEQLSAYKNNLYGVACRLDVDADGNPSGYALLISGDGHYGIADLSRNSLAFVLEWHQSGAIHKGQAANTLRAVCVDDYLAVYANGEFLGEVKDDRYRRAGQIGLIAGVNTGETVEIAFDNLTVYAGTLSD